MYGCTEVKFSHAEALSFAFPLSKKVFKHRGISGRHRPTKEQTTHFEARWGGSQSWSHWIELPRCAQRAFGLFNMESFCFFFLILFFCELWVLGSFPRTSKWIMFFVLISFSFEQFPGISKLFGPFFSDLTSEVMGMYPGDPGDPGLDCSGTVSRPQWVGVSWERLGSGPGELKHVEIFTHIYVGKMNPIWLYIIFLDGLKSTTNVRWVFGSVSCLLVTWWPDAPLHWKCPSLQPWSILRMTKTCSFIFHWLEKKNANETTKNCRYL